jgi:hypothetical protein
MPVTASPSVRLPLTVTDALGTSETITVETADWKLVFDRLYNGGVPVVRSRCRSR